MRHASARIGSALLAILLAMGTMAYPDSIAEAANSVPRRMIYNARLKTSNGTPASGPHRVRFTFWIGANAVPSDLTSTGSIKVTAPNFVGWQEEQTVTPDTNGYLYTEMGAVRPLPSFASLTPATLSNLFMQVEVKPGGTPDSSYEILDPMPLDATVDRSPILSVPFALNADRLDQRDLGTASGSIALLQSGGLLPASAMAGSTKRDTFVIDFDNTAPTEITLQFGQSLGETLKFDAANSRFVFSDDLRVEGNLTVTGLINGVDITAISGGSDTFLRVSSGGGLNVSVAAGSYRINGEIISYAGGGGLGLPDNAVSNLFFTGTGLNITVGAFPTNQSFIPLAQATTANGGVSAIVDKRVQQSDDREDTIAKVLHPGYEGAAFQADAADNVGQLSILADGITGKNYYLWTSSKDSLNDYDVLVRYTLPLDFHQWREGLFFNYRSTASSNTVNKLDIQVMDTNGGPVSLSGSTTGLSSTTWARTHVEFTGSPVWIPGQQILLRLKLSAKDNAQMHIGDITLDYKELENE